MTQDQEVLTALIKRIDKGKPKPEDITELRALLRSGVQHGHMVLSNHAILCQLIEAVASKPAAREIAHHEVEQLRQKFNYSASGPVERTLIEHITICWVRLQTAEHALTQAFGGSFTFIQAKYLELKLGEAQSRYLRAVALLEKLRRHTPPVQINIAQNQQIVRKG